MLAWGVQNDNLLQEKPKIMQLSGLLGWTFSKKRQIALALVEKVEIKKDRELKVIFKLDLLSSLVGGVGHNDNRPNTKFNSLKLVQKLQV